MREKLPAISLRDLYCFLGVFGKAGVEEVSSNDDCGSALASVAMDQDLVFPLRATLDDNLMHNLHNAEYAIVVRDLEVLPVKIVVLDARVH